MNPRRLKRKEKRKREPLEEIRCIVFLSSDEDTSIDKAEEKENRQLRYISEYADAHGLIPMKIVRRGCSAPIVTNQMYMNCIEMMKQGKAEAVLVANMHYIAQDEADIYAKVGRVRANGFRIFTVDDGELMMTVHPIMRKVSIRNAR